MDKEEGDSSSSKESKNNSLYESVIKQVVSKIRNEPFLFVIGIAALLVGLATLGTQIGSSDLRVIVVIIALLSFFVIVGYYFREPLVQSGSKKKKPTIPPVFEESRQFMNLSTFSEKKELLIHPFEGRIANGTLELSMEQQAKCESSPWDFDRIVLYLEQENSKQPKFNERLQHIMQEWEKVRASEGRRSLIPLHYAIRSTLRFLERQAQPPKDAQLSIVTFRSISDYLKARPEIDQGGEVKSNIASIIKIIVNRAK